MADDVKDTIRVVKDDEVVASSDAEQAAPADVASAEEHPVADASSVRDGGTDVYGQRRFTEEQLRDIESKAEYQEFNDITRLTRIVCEFLTDDNIHKTLEFPEIFIGIVVEVLGLIVRNGVLYMDSDEELCSPEKCDLPPIARVEGYQWMKLHLVFVKSDGEEIGCELNLTPVQMTCLIILLRFKRTPGTDMFSCVTEQRAELYYRNIEKYGELIREGKI